MHNLKGSRSGSFLGMVLFLFLGLFAAGCAGTLGSSEDKLMARKYYEEALNSDAVKDKENIIAKIKLAIENDPKEPFYRLALGNAYFQQKMFEEAEKEYLLAIRMGLPYSDGHRQLGRLYMQMRKWDEAIYHLRKVVDERNLINPHQAFNWLALSYMAKGELNNAEKTWLEALRIKENGVIRLNLGNVYMQAEQFDLAKESFLRAVQEDTGLVQAHFELGQLYLKDRNFADARTHFEKVIRIEPLGEPAKASKEYLKLMPK